MYVAWRCAHSLCMYTVILAADEVSKVGAMTMGVAAACGKGGARSLCLYTIVLAVNEVSEVGEGDDDGGGCK